jgi:hypothetical protein
MTNPYETPSAAASATDASAQCKPRGLSKWVTIPLGFGVGGVTAGLVQIPLIWVCLTYPISKWMHLNGEFDGLLLYGLPIISIFPGAFAGSVLGIFWRSRYRVPFACVATLLPALGFFFAYAFGDSIARRQPDLFFNTTSISLCLGLATAAGVWYVNWSLHRLLRAHGRAVT